MIKISKHKKKRMKERGVDETDITNALESGDVMFEELNGRFGTKRYSKLEGLMRDLIVIWFMNEDDEKEVVTIYWRRRRKR